MFKVFGGNIAIVLEGLYSYMSYIGDQMELRVIRAKKMEIKWVTDNSEKAELLARIYKKVHSLDNVLWKEESLGCRVYNWVMDYLLAN